MGIGRYVQYYLLVAGTFLIVKYTQAHKQTLKGVIK